MQQPLLEDGWNTLDLSDAVNHLQTLEGGPAGYRLRRIILANFWLYETQIFEIPHGRIFLGGENASGKSTVLTAALPLILDGLLRADRLDTFGKHDRRIEYYVLGSEESATPFTVDGDKRTSYIAMEFEWSDLTLPPIAPELRRRWENGEKESIQYFTIGIMITGNRNASKPIVPLYFLITDGSRLIKNIPLPSSTNEKNALNTFKETLKTHGILYTRQPEYEQSVSQYLFGFKEVRTFHKLIALLLTLRQPNLSSNLRLKDVYTHLTNSLLTIPEQVTRPAIETIFTIEDLRTHLSQLTNESQRVEELGKAQQDLITHRARVAFQYYQSSKKHYVLIGLEIDKIQAQITQDTQQLQQFIERLAKINQGKQETSGAIQVLEQNKSFKIAEQVALLQERVQREKGQVAQQQKSVVNQAETLASHNQTRTRQQKQLQNDLSTSTAQLKNLHKIATERAVWQEGALQLQFSLEQLSTTRSADLITRRAIENSMHALHLNADQHLEWLSNLQELHQKKAKLVQEIELASQYERDKRTEVEKLFKDFKISLSQLSQAIRHISVTLEEIHFASAQQTLHTTDDELTSHLDEMPYQENKSQMPQEISGNALFMEEATKQLQNSKRNIAATIEITNNRTTRIHQYSWTLQLEIIEKNYEHKMLQQQYQHMLNEPEHLLTHPERRSIARKHLAQHGISAFPLYKLIDFLSEVTNEERGKIEYILEDAGLLDALVLTAQDIPAADAFLHAENISDYRIKSETMQDNTSNELYRLRWMCFDTAAITFLPDKKREWREQIHTILSFLERTLLAKDTNQSTQSIGHWEHGMLSGQSGSGKAQFIGQTTRLRVRKQELDLTKHQLIDLETRLDTLQQQYTQYEQQEIHLQQNLAKLQTLSMDSNVDSIYTQTQTLYGSLDLAYTSYLDAQTKTRQKRQQHLLLVDELEQFSRPYPPFAQRHERVAVAISSTDSLVNQIEACRQDLQKIVQAYKEIEYTQQLLQRAEQDKNISTKLLEQLQNQLFQGEAALEELQKLAGAEKVENISQRLHELRTRAATLEDDSLAVFREKIILETSLQALPEKLGSANSQQQAAKIDLEKNRAHLEEILFLYPIKTLIEARSPFKKGDDSTVEQILRRTAEEGNIPFSIDTLESLQQDAWTRLRQLFDQHKQTLSRYNPELNNQKMHITFYHENGPSPFELLNDLEQNIDTQKELLQKDEKELFEQFLLEEMAEIIRKHIAEASEWVKNINMALATMPLAGDKYELEWQPKHSFEDIQTGRHLAEHLALFRKKARDLSEVNRTELKNAFSQEISNILNIQDAANGRSFERILHDIFDYRNWFQFKIYITPTGGQRQQLTQKLLDSRSGAEQLFALYIPLLAALTALYNNAAKGAPRLLGLDEAFDKASADNMQVILEFLGKQNFQWIMTGPQLNISGTPVPVIMRYLMLHEKGVPVATALPQIWQSL